ncbi:MAG TPA: bifunctional [glutamine synthetase] adenylyltransferase/[glutamine synthetase]-adenylyl-L-tyrosine phosphorylase [Acetobacteraceae bacterium]|nr:bifunctional [glutamine synthetase] adenylyltransferase/[glutamine synthetase]-adenylyl-L-tyrosine phosphorylase [Acetobacteraceae bacterium]
MQGGFRLPLAWPFPADKGAAERLIERFAALGQAEAQLAARPEGEALLRALGGNSPYLADLAVREAACLRMLAETGPETVVVAALGRLTASDPAMERPRLASLLRQAKREVALATAIADVGGLWRLEQVTGALSDLAEAALSLAARHLLLALHRGGQIRLPDPAVPDRGSGFVVLGMGKLGARELNYSSDIDLVLLYDPEAARGPDTTPGFVHARLARDLATLMEARDANGYVFRIDLRLRPDPAATPPAVALPAALAYYESMAQNWERAAMLKARPVAGDRMLGAQFLEEIRPFVWRRHLDFAAIADIHAMRRRIDSRLAPPRRLEEPAESLFARLAGHNLKLGAGGIREIEFVAQTLQLVWGGRDPSLRVPATLPALASLTRAGILAPRAAKELAASYRFLRTVEHRLQMVADRQTHSLPETEEGVARFLRFMGGKNAERMGRRLLGHLRRVEGRYREMFEPVREVQTLPQALDLRGEDEPKPAALEALRALGFADPARVAVAVQGWQTGRPRALRSERARELLFRLLPQLLSALARQRDPDTALTRFDEFLARLPAGVQILSLFQRHPALLGRIAGVFGAAAPLADYLARHPAGLEGLLAPESTGPSDTLSLGLTARLAPVQGLEEALTEIRSFVQTEGFRISVATLEGRANADEAGLARTALADVTLQALLPRLLADFARRYGRVKRGRMAVMMLGKGGGREMMAGSDLDLMLIYDHPAEVSESRGARRLPASEWFIRAVHAFIAALSAPGAEGPAFAVDMRLRPSGNKGPVAVSLASFRRYHASDAWTWERMALTRARVVAGSREFRTEVAAAIRKALEEAGPPERIRADAAAMRARVARELPAASPWDLKLRPGGLMEVEFIAQVLQLIHAPTRPHLWNTTTRLALAGLETAGVLSREEAALLLRAELLYRTVVGLLRVAVGRAPPPPALPEAVATALLHAVRASGEAVLDVAGLLATLEEQGRAVRLLFERHVGPVTESSIEERNT